MLSVCPLLFTHDKPLTRRKNHAGRQTLPVELPRVVNTVACEPAQCAYGRCGAELAVIGY